jgi:hypothetical protein
MDLPSFILQAKDKVRRRKKGDLKLASKSNKRQADDCPYCKKNITRWFSADLLKKAENRVALYIS